MTVTFQSVWEFGLDAAAEIATQGFSDYFIPVRITAASLVGMVRQDSLDLALSRVIICDGQPAGAALVARRGWTSRLAGMSIVPAARGLGLGEGLVRRLLAEARERGDRAMTLEVIRQNNAALRLYEKCGFVIRRGLTGYTGAEPREQVSGELEEVDIRVVARELDAHGPEDLPWQLSAETLAQSGPPSVALRGGEAWIVLSDPAASTIAVRALVTSPPARRQGRAAALLRAVMARYPGKTWRVPAIWPQEVGGLFEQVGWQRDQLSQWQMTVSL